MLLVGLAALKRSADADRDGRRIERLSAAALHIDTLIDRHDCLYRLTRPGFVPALAPCWHDAPALSALQRQRQLNPQRVFEHGELAPDDEQVLLDPELVTLALHGALFLAWKTEGTALYQALPGRLHATLRAVEPLRTLTEEQAARRAAQAATFRTWHETRGD